jgi:hypothetical protein
LKAPEEKKALHKATDTLRINLSKAIFLLPEMFIYHESQAPTGFFPFGFLNLMNIPTSRNSRPSTKPLAPLSTCSVQIQTVPLKVEASKVSDFYNKFFSPH